MWPNAVLNNLYGVELIEMIESLGLNFGGMNVLDLGCGTGRFSVWFHQNGAKVKGIDFSQKSIEIAKRNDAENNNTYEVNSVFEIAENVKYDLVFTWSLFAMACRNREDVISALKKVLPVVSDGGSVLFCEPFHKGFLSRVLSMDVEHFKDIMRDLGFTIESTIPMYFWPVRLILCYFSVPAFITTPMFYFGKIMMKLPILRKLADYWCIHARAQGIAK
jgi:ubiquinone/menaquinone biosynthesis C-methylase UbiE